MKKKMLTNELQIASRAKKFKGEALANLPQYIDVALLSHSFRQLNRHSSAGVDGQSWHSYGEVAPQRLPGLLSAFKPGKYKARPMRRVYIPKGKTGERPLGLLTVEDKVLQSSVRSVLAPLYE